MHSDKLKVVDLFAGAGGFSLAAHNCGCELVFAIENNKHAVRSYRNYFNEKLKLQTKIYDEDILGLDAHDIAQLHFDKQTTCDLVLGGPPCQGFSTHRIKDAGVDDPRNKLVLRYFEFVEALKPKVFLMENVPGMLWPRHKGYVDELYRMADKAGYYVFAPQKLDAQEFGVLQRRKRIFILGIRKDLDRDGLVWPPKATHAPPGKENGLLQYLGCASVFKPSYSDDPNDIHMKHGTELVTAFKNTPINGGSRKDSGRVLACHETHDGHKDVYGRIDPEKPAPTMTTACINPSKGRFVHPTEHHGITVRQAARIQTFPDDFVFCGGLIASGEQIGNAVPIILGEFLISHIQGWLTSIKGCNPLRNKTQLA